MWTCQMCGAAGPDAAAACATCGRPRGATPTPGVTYAPPPPNTGLPALYSPLPYQPPGSPPPDLSAPTATTPAAPAPAATAHGTPAHDSPVYGSSVYGSPPPPDAAATSGAAPASGPSAHDTTAGSTTPPLTYATTAPRRHPYGWLAAAAVTAIVVAAGFVAASTFGTGDDTTADPPPTQAAAPAVTTVPAPLAAAPAPFTPEPPPPTEQLTRTLPAPPPEAAAEPEAGAVGLVTIDDGVTDPRAADVAATLDTYFRGINAHDMSAVGSVLDPTGVVDPGNPREMRALADDTATTSDDDVTLWSLTGQGSTVRAHVTFRSRQAPGQGPRSDPSQTCTRWELDYTLRLRPGGYRIVKSSGPPTAC